MAERSGKLRIIMGSVGGLVAAAWVGSLLLPRLPDDRTSHQQERTERLRFQGAPMRCYRVPEPVQRQRFMEE